jgi:hypothetical protein
MLVSASKEMKAHEYHVGLTGSVEARRIGIFSAIPRHGGGSKSMIFEQAVRAEQLGLVSKTRIWDRTQVLARGL